MNLHIFIKKKKKNLHIAPMDIPNPSLMKYGCHESDNKMTLRNVDRKILSVTEQTDLDMELSIP